MRRLRPIAIASTPSDWLPLLTATASQTQVGGEGLSPRAARLKSWISTPHSYYTIDWLDITNTQHYILQEDTDSGFSNPSEYVTTDSARSFTGKSRNRYFYRVKAVGSCGSSDWSLVEDYEVLANLAPSIPSTPSPPDDAVGVLRDITQLTWDGEDPDFDDVSYDVYLGRSEPLSRICHQSTSGSCSVPESLLAGTVHLWKVVAIDEYGARTAGPLWSFTTENVFPDLSLTALVVDETTPELESTVTATATIANGGNEAAEDTLLHYSLESSDGLETYLLTSVRTEALDLGASQNLETSLQMPRGALGAYRLVARLNQRNNPPELVHSNNQAAVDLLVADSQNPSVQIWRPSLADGIPYLTGFEMKIRWSEEDNGSIQRHDLHYSSDGGPWEAILEGASIDNQGYEWLIPDHLAASSVRIRVTAHDASGNTGFAISDEVPVISGEPPVVAVLAPLGGEQLLSETPTELRWEASSPAGIQGIRLGLYRNGLMEHPIGLEIPDTGSYLWSPPDFLIGQDWTFGVAVTAGNGVESLAFSPATFRIVDSFSIPPPWNTPEEVFSMPVPPPVPPDAYNYGSTPQWNQFLLGPRLGVDNQGGVHCIAVYGESITIRDPETGDLYEIGKQGILYRHFSNGTAGPQHLEILVTYDESTDRTETTNWERGTVILIDPDGRVHVGYVVTETLIFPNGSSDRTGSEVFYTTFDGSVWTAPFNVSNTLDSTSDALTMTMTASGDLHFAWRDQVAGQSQVYHRSLSHSSGWSPSQLLLDYAYVPYLLATPDQLLLAVQRYETASEVALLRNDGSGWFTPETIWSGSFGNHIPKLTISNDGQPWAYVVNGSTINVSRLSSGSRKDWVYTFPDAESWTETTLFFDSLGYPHLGYLNTTTVPRRIFVERRLYPDGSYGPIVFIDSPAGGASVIGTVSTSPGSVFAIWQNTLLTGTSEPILLNQALYTDDLTSPIVEVLEPTGGRVFNAGTPVDILWRADDDVDVVSVDLRYSIDGATSFQDIALSQPNTGSYRWTLPFGDLPQVVIAVSARDANGNLGVNSSQPFSVVPPQEEVVLTAPNGGEVFSPGEVVQVRWDSAPGAMFSLHYSANDGETWSEVFTSLTELSGYAWTVPSSLSDMGRLRITAAFDGGEIRTDRSDSPFAIRQLAAPLEPHSPHPPMDAAFVSPLPRLTWLGGHPDPAIGVTYRVLLGTTADSLSELCVTSAFECVVPSDLALRTRHLWQVIADDGNVVTQGPMWSFYTGSPSGLVAPQGFTAFQAEDGAINLSWSDENSLAVQHSVERMEPDLEGFQEIARVDGDLMQFRDADVKGNRNYVYRVRAVRLDLTEPAISEPSTEQHVATFNNPPETPHSPDPPSGGLISTLQPTFRWAGGDPDPTDNVTWRFSLESEGTTVYHDELLVRPEWIQQSALAPNTVYTWQVVAEDGRGETALGPPWSLETPVSVPDPPTQLHVEQEGDRVYLGWDVQSIPGEGLFLERRLAAHLPYELIAQWPPEERTSVPRLSAVDIEASHLVVSTGSENVTWRVGVYNEEGYYSLSAPSSLAVAGTVQARCYPLHLVASGSGAGPTAVPAMSGSCPAGLYSPGEIVQLTAIPATGWYLGAWLGTDDDKSSASTNYLTMPSSEHTVVADYELDPDSCFALALSKTGQGEAPVPTLQSSDGCPGSHYHAGESILIASLPAPGWRVSGWSGTLDDSSTALTNEIVMPPEPHEASVAYDEGPVPMILLVDDDDNAPDVVALYESALGAIQGSPFITVWDTGNSDSEPDADFLSGFTAVVWFTGAESSGFAGPGPMAEAALSRYLDDGGCLLLTSQDYLHDRGGPGGDLPTPFMSTYLGLEAAIPDQPQIQIVGSGRFFEGMGPYDLSYPFSNHSDLLVPTFSAWAAWHGEDGVVAVSKDTSSYATTFWAFPLEALPEHLDRVDVLQRFIDGCGIRVIFQDDFESGDLRRWVRRENP